VPAAEVRWQWNTGRPWHCFRPAGEKDWLEFKSREDIIELSEVTLSHVLDFEPKDTCIYLRADDTVDHAREVFVNDIGKRVFSALVTENGTSKQRPINIITPWHFVAGNLL
jgi:hypothetical protein